MSTPSAQGTGTTASAVLPTTVAASGEAWRGWRRRWQFWVLLLVFAVLAATIYLVASPDGTERYDPESTELSGYGALTAVLEDEGVEVDTVRTGAAVLSALEEEPEATLVVSEAVRPVNPDILDELIAQDRPIVWVAPQSVVNHPEFDDLIASGPYAASSDQGALPAGSACSHPGAEAAETIIGPSALYSSAEGSALHGCFPGGAAEDGEEPGYALVETDHGVLFGAPQTFTNHQITEAGGAALGLHLFGERDHVIWYTPADGDVSGTDGGPAEEPLALLPEWFDWLLLWLLICTVLFAVIMGRRRGPLVVEPLPVEVPASESAEGRGRLYQQANAVGPSARTLRSALLLRTARLLRLGPAEEGTVIEAAARHSRRSIPDVVEILDTSQLRSNADLLRYGRRLADFEDELHTRLGLPTRAEQVAEQTSEQSAEQATEQVAEDRSEHRSEHTVGPPTGGMTDQSIYETEAPAPDAGGRRNT